MKRQFWQKPQFIHETIHADNRKVSWLELFFDLFFVVAIASVAHNFSGDVSSHGLLIFLASMIPIWWVWVGTVFYNERFETFGFENRLFYFLFMIPIAGMAVFAHHPLSSDYVGFAGSYVLARALLCFLWGRASYFVKAFRPFGIRMTFGFTLSVIIIFISLFVNEQLRLILFGLALSIDLLTPIITNLLLGGFKDADATYSEKINERFGLFTIIVLGESIVGTIAGISKHVDHVQDEFIIGILGIAIAFGMWWIYFDFVGRRGYPKNYSKGFVWSYVHMPLAMSFVATGAGLLHAVGNHGELNENVRLLVACAVGLSLISIAILESVSLRAENEPAHPITSPGLKWMVGIIAILLGIFYQGASALPLLFSLFGLQLVPMVYGLYIWFTQELDEDHYDHFTG
jgi:low temperature requirement protein LtrA